MSCTRTRFFLGWVFQLAVLVMSLLGCGPAIAQDESQAINSLAASVAEAIARNSRGSPAPVEVFVGDFEWANRPTSFLGVSLANEFAFALSKSGGFDVIDRARLTGMSQHDLVDQNAWKCYTKPETTPVFVVGTLSEAAESLALTIRVREFRALLFNRSIQIALAPNLKALASAPLPVRPTPTWVSGDHPPDPDAKPPTAGTFGVGHPACIYCPPARYSRAGTVAKVEGTAVLDIVVTTDGFPAKITLLRGLPCGMGEAAMKAAEQWRFRPAAGPDGKPVEVSQIVEVSFRLH
jgi:TonB family protein